MHFTSPLTRHDAALSRRAVLGIGAAAGVAATVGCSSGTEPGADKAGDLSSITLPVTVPFDGPKPDLPGNDAGVNPVFFAYPAKDTLKSISDGVPGDGKPITAMTDNWGPAAPALGQNPWWQQLNKTLGSDLQLERIPGADYGAKFATRVASGELPDLFTVVPTPNLPRLLDAMALDLTELVGGDAVKAYPSLAMNPAEAWKHTVMNGKILTLPIYRGSYNSLMMFARTDLIDSLGSGAAPTSSFDDFVKWAGEVNAPRQGRWVFANFPFEWLMQSAGLPNNWSEKDGKFTSMWELTDQMTDLLERARKMAADDLFHPDAWANTTFKDSLVNGKALFARDSMAAWVQYYGMNQQAHPTDFEKFRVSGAVPAAIAAAAPAKFWQASPVVVRAALSKKAGDRAETILKVINWLAAPLGSKESVDVRYGTEPTFFTWKDGLPVRNEKYLPQLLSWDNLASSPYATRTAKGYQTPGETLHAFQTEFTKASVHDPSDALYSATQLSESASTEKTFYDAMTEIVRGRQPVSSWASTVAQWKPTGDKIRGELEAALASAPR